MLRTIITKLDAILAILARIEQLLTQEHEESMAALDDLTAQVAANTSVEASAVTLINGLATQLEAALAAGNATEVESLVAQLKASAAPLAAAVAANTPAAPPAPAPTTP